MKTCERSWRWRGMWCPRRWVRYGRSRDLCDGDVQEHSYFLPFAPLFSIMLYACCLPESHYPLGLQTSIPSLKFDFQWPVRQSVLSFHFSEHVTHIGWQPTECPSNTNSRFFQGMTPDLNMSVRCCQHIFKSAVQELAINFAAH